MLQKNLLKTICAGIFVIFFNVFCFAITDYPDISKMSNKKSKLVSTITNISELKKYIGIDDWSTKIDILQKLDTFDNKTDGKAEILHLLFMQEYNNTTDKPEKHRYPLPKDVWFEIEILKRLRNLPLEKSKNIILTIVNNYISDMEKTGTYEWESSNKSKIDINIELLVGQHLNDSDIRVLAEKIMDSDKMNEVLKTYIQVPYLEYKVSQISNNEEKINFIVEYLSNKKFLTEVVGSKLIDGSMKLVREIEKDNIESMDLYIASHSDLTNEGKYFLNSTVIRICRDKVRNNQQLSDTEIGILNKSILFWSEIYPVALKRSKYDVDSYDKFLNEILQKTDNKNLKSKMEIYNKQKSKN